MKKLVVSIVALCSFFAVSAAKEVTFVLNAPMIATLGEPFRIEFELNAKPDSDSFVPPTFDNFDVVAGPSISQGSSMQIINGEMTKSVSYAITYVLLPQKAGNFAIDPATIGVKKRNYTTQRTVIEVRNAQQSSSSQQGGNRNQNESAESRSNNTLSKDDLILRLELSKRNVYKGEPIRAILKLYSRVSIAGSESSKMTAFN